MFLGANSAGRTATACTIRLNMIDGLGGEWRRDKLQIIKTTKKATIATQKTKTNNKK
eukprot:m.139772 g.139772  ORF g.139772 m.139772 type:complete len:57 (+) comp30078_c0_seq1:1053-1223(+)